MFFVEIDGKSYYPKAYCLGGIDNLKIYQLEEATTMSKLQIQNFQILCPNYINLYNNTEFYEDYSNLDFYLESNLLHCLSDGALKNKNALLYIDTNIKNN